jgi:hypothetical protein
MELDTIRSILSAQHPAALPAIALGLEPVERDAMPRPHRSPDRVDLRPRLWQHALWVG